MTQSMEEPCKRPDSFGAVATVNTVQKWPHRLWDIQYKKFHFNSTWIDSTYQGKHL